MNENYTLMFNNHTDASMGVFLYDYEKISFSHEEYNEQTVVGRRGSLITNQKAYESIQIECTFSILHEEFKKKLRQIRQWLKGTGRLQFSDEPDFYYEVQKVIHNDLERDIRKYGRFTVTFICYPFELAFDGDFPLKKYSHFQNIYDVSYPEYVIEGEGVCYLDVNGKQVRINVAQNVTIDTRRMICFRKDGTWVNTAMKGDYKDLLLKQGSNSVGITDGFNLKLYPHWGYEM